jgi:hypothetical protein
VNSVDGRGAVASRFEIEPLGCDEALRRAVDEDASS